jgi:hypothetical protein
MPSENPRGRFFGDSEKALPFIGANYPTGDYTKAPNSDKAQGDIEKDVFLRMMISKNFVGRTGDGVDQDYVDFVVQTALRHKQIDQAVGIPPEIENFSNTLRNGLNKALSMQVNNVGDLNLSGLARGTVSNIGLASVSTTAPARLGQTVRTDVNLHTTLQVQETDDFLKYLVGLAFIGISEQAARNNNNQVDINGLAIMRNNTATNIYGHLMAGSNASNSELSNLARLAYFERKDMAGGAGGAASSAAGNINNFVADLNRKRIGGLPAIDSIAFHNTMNSHFKKGMAAFIDTMLNKLGFGSRGAMYTSLNNARTGPAVKALFDTLNMNELSKVLVDTIVNEATEELKNQAKSWGYTTHKDITSGTENKSFCKHVLSSWDTLTLDEQRFFKSQLSIFEESTGARGALGVGALHEEDDLLKNESFMAKFAQGGHASCNTDQYRVNMKKAVKGQRRTVFSSTLPYVSDKITELSYTDVAGKTRKLSRNEFTGEVLREIYDDVFYGKPVEVTNHNGRKTQLTNQPPNVWGGDKKQQWNHNFQMIIDGILSHHKKSPMAVGPSANLEETLTELDTGMVWLVDGNGLYRMVNGNKVTYDDWKTKANCDNTMALKQSASFTNPQCEEVAKCILRTPEKLGSCLDQLKSDEMWEVARDGFEKMDPNIAVEILNAFRVRGTTTTATDRNRNRMEIIQPVSYTNWVESVLNDPNETVSGWDRDLKDRLKKNSKLMNYIRGVIDFVRANPTILNQEKYKHAAPARDEQTEMLNSDYKEPAYKMARYVTPYITDGDNLPYRVSLLANTANSQAFAPVPNTLSYPFVGAIYGGDGVMQVGQGLNTMGGGAYHVAHASGEKSVVDMGGYLQQMLEDLQRNGLAFSDSDRTQIQSFCEKIKKTEKQLRKMVQVLELLHNLQKFMACYNGGRHANLTHGKTLNFREIYNSHDALAWINANVGDYENCIYRGMEYINAGTNQVLQQYNNLIQDAAVDGDKRPTKPLV